MRIRIPRIALFLPLVALFCLAADPGTRPATAPATGPSTHPAASRLVGPVLLKAGDFDVKALLTGPPADVSDEHRAEVDRMLALQNSRTDDEIRRCQSEEEVTVFAFATVLGPEFNEQRLPLTANLMQRVYFDAKDVSNAAKELWKRPRPATADPRIHPCVKPELTTSYPSGHAIRGVAWAMLLAEIYPEHRDALLARGRQIGDDRFLAGMHYPSDVEAGQKLGAAIGRKLLADPAFRVELEQVRRECRGNPTD